MMSPSVPLVNEAGNRSVRAGGARIPSRNGSGFISLFRTISASAWAAERVYQKQQMKLTPRMI
jgi:hypothetical protein